MFGNKGPNGFHAFNISGDPHAEQEIIDFFCDDKVAEWEKDKLLHDLCDSIATIVLSIAASNSPEHCEAGICDSEVQHYPWTILEAIADAMRVTNETESFDEFREEVWQQRNMKDMEASIEELPENFTFDDFLERTGGSDAAA